MKRISSFKFCQLALLFATSVASFQILAQQDILQRPDEEAVKQLEAEVKELMETQKSDVRKKRVDNTVKVMQRKNNLAERTLNVDMDSFFDPKFDYSIFSGRVTDKDDTTSIIKVSSESRNIKFFRAGDKVQFRVPSKKESEFCEAFVRGIEQHYFVLYVKDLSPCFGGDDYFRRGTSLIFFSPKLLDRVREASVFRATLFTKKKDFLSQLNQLNHDVWNYEEQKMKIAAEYDKKIAEIEKQKQLALDQHLSRKNDYVVLQRELIYRLDNIDKEIDFYRIEKEDPLFDRWHKDQDLGYPVFERPEPLRARRD
ncbi:MAG: hypothetical protein L6Q33_06705 [Bacteriovoracaceae bacterium]|nr:hypothetical protein [Bacteriovoracaceae bacterium]